MSDIQFVLVCWNTLGGREVQEGKYKTTHPFAAHTDCIAPLTQYDTANMYFKDQDTV